MSGPRSSVGGKAGGVPLRGEGVTGLGPNAELGRFGSPRPSSYFLFYFPFLFPIFPFLFYLLHFLIKSFQTTSKIFIKFKIVI
jgi:hypothetical protein